MQEKYKILLTYYDPHHKPCHDEVSVEFNSILEAQIMMLKCAIEEADSLNAGSLFDTPITKVYGVTPEGDNGVTVYVLYVGNDSATKLTGYQIVPYSDYLIQEYNNELSERYGSDITVKIKSRIEDDGSIWFYYTSARHGDSDAYETIEQAYEMANDYLTNVELYV